MARFGNDKIKPFDELRTALIDIQCAANNLAEIWCEVSYDPEDKKRLQNEKKEYEKIIWFHGKNDPIIPKIEAIISDIELISKPIIFGKNKK